MDRPRTLAWPLLAGTMVAAATGYWLKSRIDEPAIDARTRARLAPRAPAPTAPNAQDIKVG